MATELAAARPATDATTTGVGDEPTTDVAKVDERLIEEELLVEEISIDGMCGVY